MIISWFEKVNARLRRVEDILLPLLFILTLLLAVTQIFLRNLFDYSFPWADPLLRVMVLWLGMLGALYATRKNRHISIDVIHHYLKPAARKIVERLVYLFSAVVCFICVYYSVPFLLLEYQDASIAFSSVPAWLAESIIPLALLIMGIRFVFFSLGKTSQEL